MVVSGKEKARRQSAGGRWDRTEDQCAALILARCALAAASSSSPEANGLTRLVAPKSGDETPRPVEGAPPFFRLACRRVARRLAARCSICRAATFAASVPAMSPRAAASACRLRQTSAALVKASSAAAPRIFSRPFLTDVARWMNLAGSANQGEALLSSVLARIVSAPACCPCLACCPAALSRAAS